MLILFSILAGLASMLGYGLANAFSASLARKLGSGQALFLRGFTVCLVLGLVSLPFLGELRNWQAVLVALGLGIAGYLPLLAFTHGLRVSRIGIVAPVANTAPLITVLLSFLFLGVVIHPLQWLAIALVIAINVVVSVDFKNWRQSNLLQLSSGIPFALCAAVGWGLFFFFLVYSVRALGPWVAAWLVEIGVTVAAGLHLVLTRQKVTIRQAVTPAMVANALLICLGTAAFTVGARYFNVAIVAALSNSTALIAALVGVFWFRERMTRFEQVAAGAMIVGVAVIAVVA